MAIEEERCKVLQVDGRLEEILETSSYFVDRSQDILEVLTARMARLENNEEAPTELPSKDRQALKQDYDLLEFAINTAEEFKNVVRKTKGACIEFFRRLLITYNRFQVAAEQRIEAFPDHNLFVEILQKRYKEEEEKIQQIKALDDQILRNEVDHSTISVQLLEDQLCLSAARIEAIKNQAAKFEINIHFLEPSEFEGITSEALAWKKFLNAQVGPSS